MNYKQDKWTEVLSIIEFAYNNTKTIIMEYTSFMLNGGYHLFVTYKKNVNLRSRSKEINELTKELRNLMAICKKHLQYTKKLQKQVHNKKLSVEAILLVKTFD